MQTLSHLSLVISPLYTRTLPSAKPTAICVRFSISARHDTCQLHQQTITESRFNSDNSETKFIISFFIQTAEWLQMLTE